MAMLRISSIAAAFIVLAAASSASAQTSTSEPLRAMPVAQPDDATDRTSILFGENLRASYNFLARHTRDSNGGSYGDNALIADFLYDGAHRRIITRSLQLGEVDDPVDIRLGRTPGQYPNTVDFSRRLPPWTLVGQIGAVGWNSNGFTAYTSGIQFHVLGDSGVVCISTAPMVRSQTRYSGPTERGDKLVCHVAVFPDGTIVLGFNSDPRNPPAVYVQGDLYVAGRIGTFRGDALSQVVPAASRESESLPRREELLPESK